MLSIPLKRVNRAFGVLGHLPFAIGHSHLPYILITILLIAILVFHEPHKMTINSIDWYANEQKVIVEGVIVDEPDRRPMQTKYTVAVDRLIDERTIHDGMTGKVLVTDRRQFPFYEFGDRIQVEGKLEKPERIEDFRYDHYLSRYDIYAVMYRGSIQQLTNQQTNGSLRKSLYSLKSHFEHQINLLYPEPHASFMAGLLTGSRRGIPDDLMEAFNATGLTHIIAISGYNITIVIALITSVLFWLPLKVRFFPAVTAIVAFTIFVGASAAVIRAAIMGILGLLALQLGRQQHTRLAILWTALIMIAWNPKILFYDAGFQLSFLAVLGLTELGPLLDRWCNRLPNTLAIRESVQMTIAAQLAAVPLIVILFDRFSLIAPLANLLVAPVIPLAMLLGALSTIISYLIFPLGQVIAYLGWAHLEWIIAVAEVGSKIPFASININISPTILISYYGILLGVITTHKATHLSRQKSTEPSLS